MVMVLKNKIRGLDTTPSYRSFRLVPLGEFSRNRIKFGIFLGLIHTAKQALLAPCCVSIRVSSREIRIENRNRLAPPRCSCGWTKFRNFSFLFNIFLFSLGGMYILGIYTSKIIYKKYKNSFFFLSLSFFLFGSFSFFLSLSFRIGTRFTLNCPKNREMIEPKKKIPQN